MALPVRDQAKYWGIATAVFFFILWWLGDVILPFILGGAIAYCLDPIADRFERMGMPRLAATIVITLIAVLVFALLALLVIPTLVNQITQLFETAPQMFASFQAFLAERFPTLLDEGGPVREALASVGETIRQRGGELLNGVIGSLSGIVNVLVLFVIVPVVTFYLLLDWDRMVARIDALLPRDHAPTIRQLGREVDNTLAAFIRGQGTVMLILGAFYAIGRVLVGLKVGLVIGGAGGLMSPLSDTDYNADLARDLGLPLVVVAANRLGVINDTLQTIITAEAKGLPIAGVVLNDVSPEGDESRQSNAAELTKRLTPRLLGCVPWDSGFDRKIDWRALK